MPDDQRTRAGSGRKSFEDPIVAFEVPVFRVQSKLKSLDKAGVAKLAERTRLSAERLIQIGSGAKPSRDELDRIVKAYPGNDW